MSRVERTRRAGVDLLQIWNYILERNFSAADQTLGEIYRTLDLIAAQPGMGEAVEHLRPNTRRFTVGNYLLLFEPVEDGIRLLRVVHGSRGVDDLFE